MEQYIGKIGLGGMEEQWRRSRGRNQGRSIQADAERDKHIGMVTGRGVGNMSKEQIVVLRGRVYSPLTGINSEPQDVNIEFRHLTDILKARGYTVTRTPPEWGSKWEHKATGAVVVLTCVTANSVRYATQGGSDGTVRDMDQWYDQYRRAWA
jgi:hypothetical protein